MISTPYHGYLKNLVLSFFSKMDEHFTALWDHGHIKFWSVNSLQTLLEEVGFRDITFVRVGRKSLQINDRHRKKGSKCFGNPGCGTPFS